jgi:hypothetical protein
MPIGWIDRGLPTAWPPSSPDLTSLDVFLQGYVKNLFYQVKNKARIRVAVAKITYNMFQNTCIYVLPPETPTMKSNKGSSNQEKNL